MVALTFTFALFLCVEAGWKAPFPEPRDAGPRGLTQPAADSLVEQKANTLRSAAYATLEETQARKFSDSDYPKVYMYDLGKEFRETDCSDFPAESQRKQECLFGPMVDLSFSNGKQLKCRSPGQFDLGRIFFDKMQSYRRLVASPEHADLFFIPSYRDQHNRDTKYYGCPKHAASKRALAHFNYTTASRHFIVSPRVSTNGLCPAYVGDRSSPNVQKISVLTIEAILTEGAFSIPYPTIASGMTRGELNELLVESRLEKRAFLATGSFGFHGPWIQLRSSLYDQCQQAHDCLHSSLSEQDVYSSYRHNSLRSTFCLEPPGDSLSRKGILDSMVLGCIPVLFQPLQAGLWPWHVPLGDVAVMLETPHKHNNVMQELRKIKAERIKELQENILKFATRITYGRGGEGSSIEDRYEDAFDTTLVNIWRSIKNKKTKQWEA